MSLPLPENVPVGKIVGRWIRIIGDSSGDENRYPDAVPAQGNLRIAPKSHGRIVEQPANANVAVLTGPETFFLDDNGELIGHDGEPGVWLVAGEYMVTPRLVGASWGSFNINVTTDNTAENPLNLISPQ